MKFAIMMIFSTSLPFPHISLTHLTHSIPYASNQPLKFLLFQHKQEIEGQYPPSKAPWSSLPTPPLSYPLLNPLTRISFDGSYLYRLGAMGDPA